MNGLRKNAKNLQFWAFWAKMANFGHFWPKWTKPEFFQKIAWNIFRAQSFRKSNELFSSNRMPDGPTHAWTNGRESLGLFVFCLRFKYLFQIEP